MTNKSLELLSQDPDGFFLMVEGGKIDLAGHDENKVNDALDTIAFDKAVKIAKDYVDENNNTILIVTADHETEGLVVLSHDLNSTLPGSLTTEAEKKELRIARINNVTVDWTATYHTNWPVPIYCTGKAFENLTSDITIDNTAFFGMMKDYWLGNPLSVDEVEPPVTTTTTTITTTTTTTTTADTITDTSTNSTTTSTDLPFDSTILLMIGISGVGIVLVVLILIRKR
jgi:alkaline phosphatase